jgi:phosphoribosylaminoimidazolecarboxamide formyltransferase/IMP cyclohydrolase
MEKTKGTDKAIVLRSGQLLRYGENPHQKGLFYPQESKDELGLGTFVKRAGKKTSYSNYLDLDTGVAALSLIGAQKPAAVILKHTNPCGAAVAGTIDDAFRKAWFDGDPLAAFGGVILFNRKVEKELAEYMLADKKFFEIIAAPGFSDEATAVFSRKPNLQLLQNKALENPSIVSYEEIRTVRGGYLVQDADTRVLTENDLTVVTKKKPTPKQIDDMLFAWKICMVSKSNCVVVVKDETLLSSGTGQQDRKRCCELCIGKAVSPVKQAVAATDGFFPFRDGPDILIQAGIAAIIQPGGSIRDQETIDACNEKGVAMVYTGVRAFKH